jgi:hypothetical protein
MNLEDKGVTGQVLLDRYATVGLQVATELVDGLIVRADPLPAAALAQMLAFDPQSAAELGPQHVDGFTALAADLHAVFAACDSGDVDAAATRLNALLDAAPAHPHLVKEGGRWQLHHHPLDASLVPAWTAICAEALARVIGDGHAARLHLCAATDCGRAYFDTTKNATRRFCSSTCQNRVKAAALRRRRAADGG